MLRALARLPASLAAGSTGGPQTSRQERRGLYIATRGARSRFFRRRAPRATFPPLLSQRGARRTPRPNTSVVPWPLCAKAISRLLISLLPWLNLFRNYSYGSQTTTVFLSNNCQTKLCRNCQGRPSSATPGHAQTASNLAREASRPALTRLSWAAAEGRRPGEYGLAGLAPVSSEI